MCLLKTSQYHIALAAFTLIAKHGDIVTSLLGKETEPLLSISDDQAFIGVISVWTKAAALLEAVRKAELTPTQEYVIEGQYTRV